MMSKARLKAWRRFEKGQWMKPEGACPEEEGMYVVAESIEVLKKRPRKPETIGPSCLIVVYCDPKGIFHPTKPWNGWWWSVPIPTLPAPVEVSLVQKGIRR